ncbi:MAG: hypothetical protein ACFB2Z_03605 [Maricaulaceae bacterium]
MARRFLIVGIVLIAGVSFWLIRASIWSGEWTRLIERFDGACVLQPGLIGAADLAREVGGDRVFAIAHDRRANPPARGAVYAVSLAEGVTGALTDLTGGAPAGFHPRALSYWAGDAGTGPRLFVLNAFGPGAPTVEVYDVTADALIHRDTLADPAFAQAQDLHAVGPNAFYFTVRGTARPGTLGYAWDYLRQARTGRVVLFDGAAARAVAQGLVGPEGLATFAQGRRLAVTETVGRALRLYDRDPSTGALTQTARAFLGSGAGRITADADDRLWIASHPNLLTLGLRHANDPKTPSPSQVLLVEPDAKRVDQIYLSAGEPLSAAGAAIVDLEAGRMLMGGLYDDGLLACDLPEVWRHSEAYPAQRPQFEDRRR